MQSAVIPGTVLPQLKSNIRRCKRKVCLVRVCGPLGVPTGNENVQGATQLVPC